MDVKPTHYDGSGHPHNPQPIAKKEPFKITDEMRKNISGNPYIPK